MHLSDVCLSVAYIGLKSRKRGLERPKLARDSDTTFRVRGQGHQVALLSVALTHRAAAVVSVGTYSAWESTAMLPSARRRFGVHGGRGAGAYRGGRPPTAWLLHYQPYAGFGVERIDPLCFLAECHKRWLNQARSVLSLSIVFECVFCCLLGPLFVFHYFAFVCVLCLGCSV